MFHWSIWRKFVSLRGVVSMFHGPYWNGYASSTGRFISSRSAVEQFSGKPQHSAVVVSASCAQGQWQSVRQHPLILTDFDVVALE